MTKILAAFTDYGHTPERKVKNTYGGIGYYRIIKPMEQLAKFHDVRVVGQEITAYGSNIEEQWDNIFKEFDVFWTGYFADPHAAGAIFYYAQKHGKKVIIDIDDNYLDIPESNQLYDRFKHTKHERAYLSATLSLADAISVSTIPLKNRLDAHFKERHGLNKTFIHVPNMNDVADWAETPIQLPKDRFTIGYSGSNSHKDDFDMVIEPILEIMRKYDHVWFEVLGLLSMKDLVKHIGTHLKTGDDDLLLRMALVGATPTFREYPKWLSERPWHVGIAPLVDTQFTRAKSHIKWMEYSMFEIPTIASNVYPYSMPVRGVETITDGKTGALCNKNDWYETLEDAVLHHDRYKKMAQQAKQHITQNWQYNNSTLGEDIAKSLNAIVYNSGNDVHTNTSGGATTG
jgi:glycosyltransferase involved in cell wall biosynthesis